MRDRKREVGPSGEGAWGLRASESILAAGLATLPHQIAAQEASYITPTITQFDLIVMMARKRPKTPQDVPISMTILAGDEVDTYPYSSNAALTRSAPNITFIDYGGLFNNSVNMRGVGSVSPLPPDDTSVVFYSDEMPLSVLGVAPNLMGMERVEVLRGLQRSLLGRNTQTGAVIAIVAAAALPPERGGWRALLALTLDALTVMAAFYLAIWYFKRLVPSSTGIKSHDHASPCSF